MPASRYAQAISRNNNTPLEFCIKEKSHSISSDAYYSKHSIKRAFRLGWTGLV